MRVLVPVFLVLCGFCAGAAAAITIPSDGSDGSFTPSGDIAIDLSLAADGAWDDPGSGNGVYDKDQWAVVFKYSQVNIPSNVDVTFINHPSGAPVIWLVSGDVTIVGTIHLEGQWGHNGSGLPQYSAPGPGGFRGGHGQHDGVQAATAGFGPGGGSSGVSGSTGPGSFGTKVSSFATAGDTYGNAGLFPLIGGSGAAGISNVNFGGGAGGGAILIAAAGTITLDSLGSIVAQGGKAYAGGSTGSGGGIRLVASEVTGTGNLNALPGNIGFGGMGRIAVEAETETYTGISNPPFTFTSAVDPIQLFRDNTTPSVRIVSVGGAPIGDDPRASLDFNATDASVDTAGSKTVVLETKNVPTIGSTVELRIVRVGDSSAQTVTATHASGDLNLSTWQATVSVGAGFSSLQPRAVLP